jgi:hypothetical protein
MQIRSAREVRAGGGLPCPLFLRPRNGEKDHPDGGKVRRPATTDAAARAEAEDAGLWREVGTGVSGLNEERLRHQGGRSV